MATPSAFWVIEFIAVDRLKQEKAGFSEQSKTVVTILHAELIKTRLVWSLIFHHVLLKPRQVKQSRAVAAQSSDLCLLLTQDSQQVMMDGLFILSYVHIYLHFCHNYYAF